MFGVVREVRQDVAVARERDPAARGVSTTEILVVWPGVQALLAHRVANALHGAGLKFPARALARIARTTTGIEIHPVARVGRGLFIDHGTRVSSWGRPRRSATT